MNMTRRAPVHGITESAKILKTLRPLRSAIVTIGGQQMTAQPRIPAQARTLLNDLGWGGH
jgi:hypothetical protein